MRRAFAALLVLVFSFPLIAPALASSPDASQLPACCRRNGKHHCAMGMEMGGSPARSHLLSEKCPYSPFARTPLMLRHAAAPAIHASGAGHAEGLAAIAGEAEAGYRISADRARYKRGPPAAVAAS
jgi:hypothetical protein